MLNTVENLSKLIDKEIKLIDLGKKPASLYDPLYYILSLGGKRIRPLLTLMAYTLYRDHPEEAIKPALAVEVFHNFTLMHDDIMDKAPLRRGRTTVHEKWDSNVAILSGDVMLIKAYELLMHVETKKLKKIISAFNTCAALVCEGQQFDMDFETRKEVLEEEYIEMIKLKTAVLLGFSLELGGIIGEASDQDCEALRNFGINIGIGFQLKDDLLDVYADQSKFGKQVGGDIIANKKTLLLIEAINKSKGKTKQELFGWLSKEQFDPAEKVNAIMTIYDKLNVREIAEQKIDRYFSIGLDYLSSISAPKHKIAILKTFTQHLINREK
ncbi:MAG: polyprenyl synthetase family protein [Cyclobacteriaceae bacterium]|nr:polyprenyl synthetase family protein [Cyclobacteriaceae bacterium]